MVLPIPRPAFVLAITASIAMPASLTPVTTSQAPSPVVKGISEDYDFDLDAIAEVIDAQAPDIVMLHEVDRGFLISYSHDVLALL
jgi:hypothetical protein